MICGEKWNTCDCAFFNNDPIEPYDDFDTVPVPTLARSETFPMTPTYRNGSSRFVPPMTAPPLGRRGASDLDDEVFGHSVHSAHEYRERDLAARFERHSTPRDHRYRERSHSHLRPRDAFEDNHRVMMEDEHDDDDDDDGYDYDDDDDYRGLAGVDEALAISPRRRRRVGGGAGAGAGGGGGGGGGDDYMRGGTVVPPAPPTVPHGYEAPGVPHGFDRSTRTAADYISDVSKARGVRGSSMERRLADRFSPQRGVPHPQLQPLHHMPPHIHQQHPPSPLSPLMPMGGPHGHGHGPLPPHVPMMPPPVPAVPTLMRRHTGDEDAFNMGRGARAPERAGPGRSSRHEYPEEAMMHAPMTHRRRHSDDGVTPRSTMAGLTGAGRGMNRVYEWRNYVEPGLPGSAEESMAPAPTPTRQRLHY